MRETKFIEQNKDKWAEFEAMLRSNNRDPDKLNDLYIQITDDLSYARTFYPNRSVRQYLNSLAQRVFHNVYRGRRFPRERIRLFWTAEIPQVVWESRKALLVSLSLFVLAFMIGVVSSIIEPEFARTILSDAYVEMTLENIENGDPMAVYKESRPLGMSAGIAANNLFVAMLTALSGVLASVGTVFIMLYNGIMVGAFQYFFIEKGLFWESFLTIWIHGTLEISAIIIAGGAGLVAGSGLLFPGTYSRTRAFQISMRRGLKIFVGIVPIIILAALFEGFLTRYTQTPDGIRGIFIAASLAFVLWYFVWYPWYRARKGLMEEGSGHDLLPDREVRLKFDQIKTSGEIFSDVFLFLRRNRLLLLWFTVGYPLVFLAAGVLLFSALSPAEVFRFPSGVFGVFDGVQSFFSFDRPPALGFVQFPLQMLLAIGCLKLMDDALPPEQRQALPAWRLPLAFLTLALPVLGLSLIFNVQLNIWVFLLTIALFPLLCTWAAAIYFEGYNPFTALFRTLSLVRFSQLLVLGFLVSSLGLLLFLFFDSWVWDIILRFLVLLIPSGEQNVAAFNAVFTTLVSTAVLNFLMVLNYWTGALVYFSGKEIADADSLRAQIPSIGTSRQIRGLARE